MKQLFFLRLLADLRVRVGQRETDVVRVRQCRVDLVAVVTAKQDLTVLLLVRLDALLHLRT